MNKKILFAIGAILILIIAIILFLLQSCEPRIKEPPITEEAQVEITIERNDFINANIEFTCELLQNPELMKDKAQTEIRVKEVFKKHGLPVDDNESMMAVLQKYENDMEIAGIVKTNAKPCAQGGEPIFVQ